MHGRMKLWIFPLILPISPMLAKRVEQLPDGDEWIFEPKWDGFRSLVFRDGDEIFIQSRDEKPLNRYFPELLDPLRSALPKRCVLDGEVVIVRGNSLDFDALQLRLHPAASRITKLSAQTPASFVAFDLLSEGRRDLRGEPFENRREQLESLLASARPPIHLTPASRDRGLASDWFRRFEGAGLDGVIAKSLSGTYEPGKRVMIKVKHERDCDCVVAGFRWHKRRPSRDWVVTAWALRRCGPPATRWGMFQLYCREAPRVGEISEALSQKCTCEPSMEKLG